MNNKRLSSVERRIDIEYSFQFLCPMLAGKKHVSLLAEWSLVNLEHDMPIDEGDLDENYMMKEHGGEKLVARSS